MARVLVPLPDHDFDTTEVTVPWKILSRSGHDVVFATERGGTSPECDPRLLTGVIFGQLGADPEPIQFYREMQQWPSFKSPISWSSVDPQDFDGLLLSGGHAQGMKQYLESAELHAKVGAFWALDRPVGAICHGTIVMSRSVDPRTGKSVLWNARTTCLPKYMELNAWLVTAWRLGRYYRTYPEYVEDEVCRHLENPAQQFVRGPFELMRRGSDNDDRYAFVVEDGRYVSGRWPGDSYLYAKKFMERLPK
jgi:putative intracellular protease/amidase